MSDIFEEVEEEIRKDRLSELWKKYGIFAWLAMGAIVGAVALNEYRNYRTAEAAESRMLVIEDALDALDDGDYAAADAALTEIASSNAPIAPLAAQYLAHSKLTGSGDAEAAATLLVAEADAEGSPYEKLSLLKAAYLRADTLELSELETLLGPLVTDEGPVGSLARELVAAKAYAAGDITRARTEFNRLKFEAAAPQGVIRRAELALAAMPAAPAPTVPVVPAETQPDEAETDTPETNEETGE